MPTPGGGRLVLKFGADLIGESLEKFLGQLRACFAVGTRGRRARRPAHGGEQHDHPRHGGNAATAAGKHLADEGPKHDGRRVDNVRTAAEGDAFFNGGSLDLLFGEHGGEWQAWVLGVTLENAREARVERAWNTKRHNGPSLSVAKMRSTEGKEGPKHATA